MEFFGFVFDFFLDPNVYVAGVIVYLFGPKLNKFAKWAWGKVGG